MRTKYITVVFLFFAVHSIAKDSLLPEKFANLLETAHMTFNIPKGFVETPIIVNKQMNYDYALTYPGKIFEVRFAIRPLAILTNSYREKVKSKNPGDIFINPNNLYPSLFNAILLNISDGKLPNMTEFDKTSVKEEFHADWGATTALVPGHEFGQSYKYCMVVSIHKDDCADAYIFFLADSVDTLSELNEPAFYALIFK